MSRNEIFIYMQREILLRLQETNGEHVLIVSLPAVGIAELVGVELEPEEVSTCQLS